mgnify:CR=1 FL=1
MGFTWQYYDLVLLGITASIVAGLGVGAFTSVGLSLSIPAFALVAVGLIGHGLFVNGPVEEPADLTEEVETLN